MLRIRSPFNDPRVALFGLTLFSNANPGIEKRLENFAQVLENTRNSIIAIRSEMQQFETSMYSLNKPPKANVSTQPVHPPKEQQPDNSNYNQTYPQSPNYNQGPVFEPEITTMEVKQNQANKERLKTQLEKQLEKYLVEKPEKLDDFLADLEEIIKKYK